MPPSRESVGACFPPAAPSMAGARAQGGPTSLRWPQGETDWAKRAGIELIKHSTVCPK